MNNGKNLVIIRPTDNTADRVRALMYYSRMDRITAQNIQDTREFKTIKIRQPYIRLTLLYSKEMYFKNCDFIEIV